MLSIKHEKKEAMILAAGRGTRMRYKTKYIAIESNYKTKYMFERNGIASYTQQEIYQSPQLLDEKQETNTNLELNL